MSNLTRILNVFRHVLVSYLEDAASIGVADLVDTGLVHAQRDAVEKDDGHADPLEPRIEFSRVKGKHRDRHFFVLFLLFYFFKNYRYVLYLDYHKRISGAISGKRSDGSLSFLILFASGLLPDSVVCILRTPIMQKCGVVSCWHIRNRIP